MNVLRFFVAALIMLASFFVACLAGLFLLVGGGFKLIGDSIDELWGWIANPIFDWIE